MVTAGYEAQIWVTGSTHVIGFYRDKVSLIEALAEDDNLLPQRGLLFELAMRGEKAHESKRWDGINYLMNFQIESMSPMVYNQTHHDLARLGARRGLFVPFPEWTHQGLTPFSFIDYEAKPNELHVFAFHAFPENLAIVKTQSLFELA